MRLFFAGLLSALLFVSQAAAESPVKNPSPSFQEALQLREAGNLEEAEHRFKQALEAEPVNPDYHFELANLYALRHDVSMKSKQDEEALSFLEKSASELRQVVMYRPDYIAAQFNLGVVYKKLGEFEKAREQFKEVLKLEPNSLPATMQIGATYEEQGFYDEAQSIYHKAQQNYADPSINDALHDLENHKANDQRRSQSDLSRSMDSIAQTLRYQQQNPNYGYQNANQGATAAQALPYLGSWVLQQFMSARHKSES